MYRLIVLLSLYILAIEVWCQDYTLNGDAIATGNNCYSLTPNQAWQNGTVWYQNQLDLNESFSLEFYMSYGAVDGNGADGMVFVLQTVGSTAIGLDGGGMGFQGFDPSLGIEFDTFSNADVGDIAADHVAFLRDGIVNHFSSDNLAGPIQASANSTNIEDGQEHLVKITWQADTEILTLYFDCEERLSEQVDLIGDIFNGNNNVFWGFTGATGFYYNAQSVCLEEYYIGAPQDYTVCLGEQVQLSASGNPAGNFLWSPADGLNNASSQTPIASPSVSMEYCYTYTDLCNSITTGCVLVNIETPYAANAGEDTFICEAGTLELNANGVDPNATLLWSTIDGNIISGDNIANPIIDAPGSYTIELTTPVANCISQDQITISETPLPVITTISPVLFCPGETATLSVTSFYDEILWQTNETTPDIIVNEAGLYNVSVTLDGCSNNVDIAAEMVDVPVVELGPDVTLCEGDNIILDAGIEGQWSNGVIADLIIVSLSGNYSFLYSDQGCEAGDDIMVEVISIPEINLGPDQVLCPYDTLQIQLPFEVNWNTGITGNSIDITSPGVYSASLSEALCISNDQIQVLAGEFPVADLGNDLEYCNGKPLTLSVIDERNDNYQWSNSWDTPAIEVVESGVYSVVTTNFCGSASDTIQVTFLDCDYYIFIPNAFTPDDDGINDFWKIETFNILEIDLTIYNRWGEIIFRTGDANKPWTGGMNGSGFFAPDGVYIYRLEFENAFGYSGTRSGTVAIVR
jgi:gliding motility-associated-like protein